MSNEIVVHSGNNSMLLDVGSQAPRPHRRGPSYTSIAQGGLDLRDKCKAASDGIVQIETDDLRIDLGYFMGTTQGNRYKVCTCTQTQDRHSVRQVWEVLSIDPNRITTFNRLS